MRKILSAVVLLAVAPLVALEAGEATKPEPVPVTEVVLFSSGVGYFGRSGKIKDDVALELTFKSEQINDLLKSLVVLDLDGGKVSGVSYASQDPTGKALKAFGLDLAENPSLGDLLRQLRGVPVSLASGEGSFSGTVVSVETQTKKLTDEAVIEFDVLNLLTPTGIKSFAVSELRDIKITDDNLREDLTKALAVLARSRDTEKRAVTIGFSGKGERRVTLAYILEAPVWKTSYRLLLGEKPLLQGWAIVENTTDSDWKDVSLSLVSGRPVSFIQDLYTPLYLPRPVVQPKLFAGLRPQEYDEGLEKMDEAAKLADAGPMGAPAASKALRRARGAEDRAEYESAAAAPAAPQAGLAGGRWGEAKGGKLEALAQATMAAMATGKEAGELFRYTVNTPVTIGRQSSAMLPIVAGEVTGEKLSIYNNAAHPQHPYSGYKLKNTTKLALLAGPVTVFEDGVYAGDAQLVNLQPDEERLISYGLDLACTVEMKSEGRPQDLVSAKIVNGVLQAQYKYFQLTDYTVKNKKDAPKTVLVEHPYIVGWDLTVPKKYDERTESVYRFRVPLKAKETQKLSVALENVQTQVFYLTNVDDNFVGIYVQSKVVSEKVKVALKQLMEMKTALNDLSRKARDLEQQKNDLYREQERIRSNLNTVPKNSELYTRYVEKMGTQETQIEKVMTQIAEARDAQQAKQKEINDYLSKLSVE